MRASARRDRERHRNAADERQTRVISLKTSSSPKAQVRVDLAREIGFRTAGAEK
jgi:hypothetical protein